MTVAYYTGSAPLGVEIHASVYAFDEPQDTALNNTVFVSYKIFNRSNSVYSNSYFGAFSDFDLGYGFDDFIGCDVKAGMAYGFNGDETDGPGTGSYTGVPPAQGCIMLAGPYEDPDNLDNPIIDIAKMQMYYPEQLANYLRSDGTYDTLRLNADADLYYPDAWNYTDVHYDVSSDINNPGAFINGLNYGNGIVDDERMGMCKFVYYDNSANNIFGEPSNMYDYFYYLRGRWKDGEGIHFGILYGLVVGGKAPPAGPRHPSPVCPRHHRQRSSLHLYALFRSYHGHWQYSRSAVSPHLPQPG